MYRLKFKSNAFEVEMEGPDQTIIDGKLNHLISISQKSAVGLANSGSSITVDSNKYYNTIEDFEEDEIQVIESRSNFIEVVKDLGLNVQLEAVGSILNSEIYNSPPFKIQFLAIFGVI